MLQICDPDSGEIIAVQLTEQIETETLGVAIGAYLDTNDLILSASGASQADHVYEARFTAEELHDDIIDGERFLYTKAQLFCARISLNRLRRLHEVATTPAAYEIVSSGLGLRPAKLFEHAIEASHMLKLLPEFEDDTEKLVS